MRLFLALDLPSETREGLRPLTSERLSSAKWVAPEQWHLTLRFLGEQDEKFASSLRRAINDFRFPAFSLQPRGLGVFPDARRPRVLWVGLEAPSALFTLQKSLEEILGGLGLPTEDKAFHPHLTLARFKSPPGKDLEHFLQRHQSFALPPFEVREFHLYSSRLSPKGAEHTREAAFPLN